MAGSAIAKDTLSEQANDASIMNAHAGLKRSKPDEKQHCYRPVAVKDMTRWQQMSQDERDSITRRGFAQWQGINPVEWRRLIKLDGELTAAGKKRALAYSA